jgi:DNA-directed RNA polymerase delta subunit
MAEGITFADSEEAEDEGLTEDGEGVEDEMDTDEEMDEDLEEDEIEEGEPEEDEDATPVTVQCPKCDTHNVVTTSQRPYEFRCEKCNALLRLSR